MVDAEARRALQPPIVRRARLATYGVLLLNGVVTTSWVVHAPSVIERSDLTGAQFGLAGTAVGLGSVVVIPVIGFALGRFGPRPSTASSFVLFAAGFAVLAVSTSFPLFLLGLLVAGAGSAMIESCGSTSGSRLEHLYGRNLMPGFIGMLALGMLLGTVYGAWALWAGVSMRTHLLSVSAMLLLGGLVCAPFLLSARVDPSVGRGPRARARFSWRLVAVSLLILVSVVEGATYAFAAVYMVEDLGTSAAFGAFAVAAHTVGTATCQFAGGPLRERFGAGALARAFILTGGAVAVASLVTANPWVMLVGFAALGASVAFIYPAGLSAAADTQPTPATGVALAQTARYVGVFGAAPLVGAVADRWGYQTMFIVATVFSVATVMLLASALGVAPGLAERSGGSLPTLDLMVRRPIRAASSSAGGAVGPADGIAPPGQSDPVPI